MLRTTANESAWEKKLGISTVAADYEKDDKHHSRYEPTSYAVLERLSQSGWLNKDNMLIDYGCGKGRVGFFLNYALGMRTFGVEYNPELCALAENNLHSYAKAKGNASDVSFVCVSAESHAINNEDCFYFFNPFSVSILQSVLGRIIDSYFDNPRPMLLFFYYPTDEYSACLMEQRDLQLAGEIDCRDLFHNDDPKEKILVFRIAYEI